MSLNQTVRRNILRRFVRSHLQIAPEALDYIVSLDTPTEMAELVIQRVANMGNTTSMSVISRELIESLLSNTDDVHVEQSQQVVPTIINESDGTVASEVTSQDIPPVLSILKSPDVYTAGSAGVVEDFVALFNDRLQRIHRMFMGRIDTHGAVSPADVNGTASSIRRRSLPKYEQYNTRGMQSVKIIGMVKEKSVSRSHNLLIELEGSEGSILCVVPSGQKTIEGQELAQKGNMVLLDTVICVSGHVDREGFMIVDDITFPDIPTTRTVGRSQREVYAVFLSDLHVGSREFLEDAFDSFLKWLNGHNTTEQDRNIVRQIGYVLIAGDLCDGIGVYPDQERALVITSIYDQYSALAEKLKEIPTHIRLVIIPGNHDACRQALPRPPLSRDFASALYELGDRVFVVGDPCYLNIEGVNVLMSHGDSLDDLVVNVPGLSYRNPAQAMALLLRMRHLAPIYGGKTEIAPVTRDWMVIDSVPDIVHFGHAHHNAVDNYRGVQIINSGTFQAQTDFMRKQGVVPTPGIVTLVNLRTGTPELRFFHDIERSN